MHHVTMMMRKQQEERRRRETERWGCKRQPLCRRRRSSFSRKKGDDNMQVILIGIRRRITSSSSSRIPSPNNMTMMMTTIIIVLLLFSSTNSRFCFSSALPRPTMATTSHNSHHMGNRIDLLRIPRGGGSLDDDKEKKKKKKKNETMTATAMKNETLPQSPPPPPPPRFVVLKLIETEVWDGTKWTEPLDEGSRWTDAATGRSCAAPNKQTANAVLQQQCRDEELELKEEEEEEEEGGWWWTYVATFQEDWKIVTTSSSSSSTQTAASSSSSTTPTQRDEYGWEYIVAAKPHASIRQRTWLRTVVISAKPKKKKSSASKTTTKTTAVATSTTAATTATATASSQAATTSGKKRSTRTLGKTTVRRPRPAYQRWMQAMNDNFNFKGFGWTFYKSLVDQNSFGLALRLPLTNNFDLWESHPGWPSVSTNVCLWHPLGIMLFLSGSMRIEWIKWATAQVVRFIQCVVLAAVLLVYRGLALVVSALVFPWTRTWPVVPLPALWPASTYWKVPAPAYNRDVEERLGCSMSWRYTLDRGYQFRISYWHFYGPTLTSIWRGTTQALMVAQERCDRAAAILFPSTTTSSSSHTAASQDETERDESFDEDLKKNKRKKKKTTKESLLSSSATSRSSNRNRAPPPAWFARRSAAWGVSTSSPTNDPPWITMSTSLSLSGFYFRPPMRVTLTSSSGKISEASSVTSAATIESKKDADGQESWLADRKSAKAKRKKKAASSTFSKTPVDIDLEGFRLEGEEEDDKPLDQKEEEASITTQEAKSTRKSADNSKKQNETEELQLAKLRKTPSLSRASSTL